VEKESPDKSFIQNIKDLWQAWKRVTRKIGDFQARVLLTIIYGTIVLPFGLLVRLFSDPLHIKHRPTKWTEQSSDGHDLDWAQKQS
jgi:hypothetical protein